MASNGHVEVAEFVPGERVSAALDHHDIGNIEGTNSAHDLFE